MTSRVSCPRRGTIKVTPRGETKKDEEDEEGSPVPTGADHNRRVVPSEVKHKQPCTSSMTRSFIRI